MNVVAEIQRLNERELELNVPFSGSWHQKYRESAWIFLGGLPFELTEGDVLCVLSQFGEIEDIHLVRDSKTGKSKGFAFVKYEDQRSTVLAVDNLNGFKLLERVLRVDHVLKYKLPKELQEESESDDEDARRPRGLPGHAYEGKELASSFDLEQGVNVFAAPEMTRKEKKKRKKQEKKAKKAAKKVKKIEKKQLKILQQVQKRRQQVKKEEEEEQAAAAHPDVAQGSALPSTTGWRGRLEPSVTRPRREMDTQPKEREQDPSFGGMRRVR